MSEPKKKKKEPEIPVNYVKTEFKPKLRAKKAFEIIHNGYMRKIAVGDDLTDVPEIFHQNLKTEGVI